MSYNIKTYNGNLLTVIADGTIDNTTELSLVGKNYSGYGTIQNDNFIYLLENFANSNPPTKTIAGQLWYDSNNNHLKFYDKNLNWRSISGADISITEPSYLTTGDFWFDTNNKQLSVFNGTGYTLIGPPQTTTNKTTVIQASTVYDSAGTQHDILVAIVDGSTIFTVSNDLAFTLNNMVNPINGFNTINPGITLINTTAITKYKLIGTSTNADAISVIDGSKLTYSGTILGTATTTQITGMTGVIGLIVGQFITIISGSIGAVGGITTIKSIDSDTQITITSTTANTIGTITFSEPSPNLLVQASVSVPTITDKTSIVSRDSLGDIYATTFHGDISGSTGTSLQSDKLLVGSIYASAVIGASLNTIVARDENGKVYADGFVGNVTGNVFGTANNANKLQVGTGVYNEAATAATSNTIVSRDNLGDIYATTFHGNISGGAGSSSQADKLLVGSTYESADTSATINTIAARNGSGDIYATTFHGAGTSLTGTAIGLSIGGNAVTATNAATAGVSNTTLYRTPTIFAEKNGVGGLIFTLKAPITVVVQGAGVIDQFTIITDQIITIPIGASLGVPTGTSNYLAFVFMASNNSLGVINISSSSSTLVIDESNSLTPVVISGASTATHTLYSSSGTQASYYKIVGFANAKWTNGTGWSFPHDPLDSSPSRSADRMSASSASYVGTTCRFQN